MLSLKQSILTSPTSREGGAWCKRPKHLHNPTPGNFRSSPASWSVPQAQPRKIGEFTPANETGLTGGGIRQDVCAAHAGENFPLSLFSTTQTDPEAAAAGRRSKVSRHSSRQTPGGLWDCGKAHGANGVNRLGPCNTEICVRLGAFLFLCAFTRCGRSRGITADGEIQPAQRAAPTPPFAISSTPFRDRGDVERASGIRGKRGEPVHPAGRPGLPQPGGRWGLAGVFASPPQSVGLGPYVRVICGIRSG